MVERRSDVREEVGRRVARLKKNNLSLGKQKEKEESVGSNEALTNDSHFFPLPFFPPRARWPSKQITKTMLLCRPGARACRAVSALRHLSFPLFEDSAIVSEEQQQRWQELRSSTASALASLSSFSSSSSPPCIATSTTLHCRHLSFAAASSSSNINSTETESHACVPEGATLAEEGAFEIGGDKNNADDSAGDASAQGEKKEKKKKKKPLPPRLRLPSLDPLRTSDALWPQTPAQRRVGKRVHSALQAILSSSRGASALPEAAARELFGGGGGFGGDADENDADVSRSTGSDSTSSCGFALAGARASPDGKSVFVLYDCTEGTEDRARAALRSAAGPLRSAVARVAGFKRMPRLVFVRDGEGGVGGESMTRNKKRRSKVGYRGGGGTVGEIEAEMERLGLLGGGGEGGGGVEDDDDNDDADADDGSSSSESDGGDEEEKSDFPSRRH